MKRDKKGRFTAVPEHPRRVYGDDVLEALYEDIRQWPEVESLDSSNPEQPVITFLPIKQSEQHGSPTMLPPVSYVVDYSVPEDLRWHYSNQVWTTEHGLLQLVSHHKDMRNWYDVRIYAGERVIVPLGSVCHGEVTLNNYDPFSVFAAIMRWHIGVQGNLDLAAPSRCNRYWASHPKPERYIKMSGTSFAHLSHKVVG